MRASGVLVVFASTAIGIVGSFTTAACTYTASGQGGSAGAISFWSGDGSVSNSGSGSGSGSSSGGAPSSSGGQSSGGQSSGGQSSGGTTTPPSGGADASAPITCPSGLSPCNNGECCANGAPTDDAAAPCEPPPNFPNDCTTYVNDQDAGAACASCMQQQEQCVQPTCQATSGCTNECAGKADPEGMCDCVASCLASTEQTCCIEQLDNYFNCLTGACSSVCSP